MVNHSSKLSKDTYYNTTRIVIRNSDNFFHTYYDEKCLADFRYSNIITGFDHRKKIKIFKMKIRNMGRVILLRITLKF